MSTDGKLRKSLENPPESPWFDWIADGIKKYEGRLLKDDWATLEVGDLITFINPDGRELTCRVISLPRFSSFVEAFEALGPELVPVPNVDNNKVRALYSKFYSQEQQSKYGVVAIQLEPTSE